MAAEATTSGTPWAPSQHAGMKCCCRHWDAVECSRLRVPVNPLGDPEEVDFSTDDRCECACHDRDEDDDEQSHVQHGPF